MKILIAGGAGFIGSNLTSFHLGKGDEVFTVDNLITGSKKNIQPFQTNKNFHFFKHDILTFDFRLLLAPRSSKSEVGTFDFDIIYHLASPASPIQYKKHALETLRTNSEGTRRILEYMRNSNSKSFVLASTSEVYGDPLIHPQIETYWGNVNPVGIRACYDEGKRYAEALTMEYFRKYGINVRIARIFNTYGPNMEKDDGRVVSNFIMQSLTNKPITVYGDGTQTRSFCFVSDMVSGLYSLATTKNIASEIINIGNPEEYTITELANIIKKEVQSNSSIVNEPIEADDPKKRKPDINKALKILGWQPKVPLLQGLKKTILYFQNRFI